MSIEIEATGFEEQLRKLKGYNRLSQRQFARAMGKSVIVLTHDWKEVAPVLHGRYRNSLAGRIVSSRVGIGVEGGVETNVTDNGFPYPAALEESEKYRYRAGPRAGQRTAGRVKKVLKKNTKRINGFFSDALDEIVKRLEV